MNHKLEFSRPSAGDPAGGEEAGSHRTFATRPGFRPAFLTVDGLALRIAIQGVRGSFHEIAARQFFGRDVRIVPALSFPELFRKTADPAQADAAILAIENSIAGSILGNYKLLLHSDLQVVGEVHLPIRQNLLALPGVTLGDLREVHSHPMALAQCADFFQQHPRIRLVESDDTAESAARIARRRARHIGAIASALAAEYYGLNVLAPAIETVAENYTRFLALGRAGEFTADAAANKAAVCFTTTHQPGSLARALAVLAGEKANLTKIQSVPILGRPWEYRFFADFSVDAPGRIASVIDLLRPATTDLKVLGIYPENTLKT